MRRAAAALTVLAAIPLAAQQPAFKAGVDLVRIPVTIMRGGEPAKDGLAAADFTLAEDGVAQAVTLFERESLPISLLIALDVSGSMSQAPAQLATTAITDVTSELREPDEVAILTFADSARVLLPWSSPTAAARTSMTAEIAGTTSLHDATRTALDMLDEARNARAIVLLITDGFDTSSRTRLTDVVKTRRQSEALIYGFAVGAERASTRVEQYDSPISPVRPDIPTFMPGRDDFAVSSIASLVGDSGGTTYQLTNTGDSRRISRRFIDELRYQYTIGYTPAKAFDGKYRRVKVELKKKGYQIRYRGGYLASQSP